MNFVKTKSKRALYYIISIVLIILSIVGYFTLSINKGIDFSGGTLFEVKFNQTQNKTKIQDGLKDLSYIKTVKIQETENNSFLLRTNPLSNEDLQNLRTNLLDRVGEYQEIRLETVHPLISSDTTNKAITATILASIAIILYVAYAFRSIPKPASSWKFGIVAVIALIHDLVITSGIFVFLSHFYGYELDSYTIIAALTILGFSVNDTIVIFDRIREHLKTDPDLDFAENVNRSLIQTISRSLNTTITLILVLLALLFLGGESTKQFVAILIVGTFFGALSSIFVAPPLLVDWHAKAFKKS